MDYLIEDKETLKNYIESDKKACLLNKNVTREMKYRLSFRYRAFCFMKMFRTMEFLCFKRDHSDPIRARIISLKIKKLDRKINKESVSLGIELVPNHIGKGVRIAHPNVVLNGYVGEGCVFHGNNVLGNKKTGDANAVPHLGNNIDVGIGAMIIGDIEIADNCVIGAGSVVTKSFTVPGTVIAGVPAKEIRK